MLPAPRASVGACNMRKGWSDDVERSTWHTGEMPLYQPDELPGAVASLLRQNHYSVIGPLHVNGAEVDLKANSLSDPFVSLARVMGPPDCQGDGTTVARY